MLKTGIRYVLGILELISCIACNIIKIWTDQLARQTAVRNQKYSREWGLLSNITWTKEGNSFAIVTYGGYTIISAMLLLSRCSSKEKHSTLGKSLLFVGALLFLALGSLIFASVEQAPVELHTNAFVLGSLSYFVAFLFIMDLALDGYTSRTKYMSSWPIIPIPTLSQQTQTDQTKFTNKSTRELGMPIITDIVKTSTLPTAEEPIFAKLLLPEKQRAKAVSVEGPDNKSKKSVKMGYVANMARRWDRTGPTKSNDRFYTFV